MTESRWIKYLQQLNHHESEVRRQAILKLGESDDPHIYKILSGHFSDGHPVVREALVEVFSRAPNRRLAEVVADTLHSPQMSVQSLAMEILRRMGAEAEFPLRRISKSTNLSLRRMAAELLGDIREISSTSILLDLLEDSSFEVVLAAICSLGKKREIRALPRLFQLMDEQPDWRMEILDSLSNIFFHWEKLFLGSDTDERDHFSTLSLLGTVQAHANPGAMDLVLQCVKNAENELAAEALKALAAILKNNSTLIIPSTFYLRINQIWEKNQEDLPAKVFSICLSRIPCSDAFQRLLEFFAEGMAQESLYSYISHFPSFFVSEYRSLKSGNRRRILSALVENQVKVYDSRLFAIYQKLRTKAEKEDLLELCALSQLPEARRELLAQISRERENELPRLLRLLNYFADQGLWPVYLKYFNHSEPTIWNAAAEGLARQPKKLLGHLMSIAEQPAGEILDRHLFAIFKLPLSFIQTFLEQWLADPDDQKLAQLANFFVWQKDGTHLMQIVRVLQKWPEKANRFLKEMSDNGIRPVVSGSDTPEYNPPADRGEKYSPEKGSGNSFWRPTTGKDIQRLKISSSLRTIQPGQNLA